MTLDAFLEAHARARVDVFESIVLNDAKEGDPEASMLHWLKIHLGKMQ